MLTDLKLKNLKANEKPYKVADRDGLYVLVTPAGSLLLRYDYRINSRRETLALGRYDDTRAKELPRELDVLDYGMGMSLAEARLLLTRARRSVEAGESPAKAKAEAKNKVRAELTLDGWADKYFEDADLAPLPRPAEVQHALLAAPLRRAEAVRCSELPVHAHAAHNFEIYRMRGNAAPMMRAPDGWRCS